MIYEITEGLPQKEAEKMKKAEQPVLIVTEREGAQEWLECFGFGDDWELDLSEVYACKVETMADCVYGSLVVPNMDDLFGARHRMLFFINKKCLLFVNEDAYAEELISHLRERNPDRKMTTEKILSLMLADMIARDTILLERFEQELMEMETHALHRQNENFLTKMMHVRRQLLILHGFYEQFMEVGRELEENENDLFEKKQLKYFGTVGDRAQRLLHRCKHLLDYAGQVKEVYQGQVDEHQNRNMQYLTVVSTIFFPLTLITGWYGMNFENMPELAHGYPYVICVSILVIVVCIVIFKKKKIL